MTRSDVVKREIAAEALAMAVGGGGFNRTMGSIELYGLIQTGGGEVRITELAKTTLFGEKSEVAEAKARAVRTVKLFGDLFATYGPDPTDEQLRVFLRQRAMVDVEKVGSLAQEVGKVYKSVAVHLRPMTQAGERQTAPPPQPAPSSEPRVLGVLAPGVVRLAYRDFVVDVPDDDLEVIEAQFQTMLTYLRKKRSQAVELKPAKSKDARGQRGDG